MRPVDRETRQRVAHLLLSRTHSIRQIAGLTNVSLATVHEVKTIMLNASALSRDELVDSLQVAKLKDSLTWSGRVRSKGEVTC